MIRALVCLSLLSILLVSAAPGGKRSIQDLEQSFVHKLHQSWHTQDASPNFPRKGEYKCKGGICKTKSPCEDCQGPIPLDVGWEKIKVFKDIDKLLQGVAN